MTLARSLEIETSQADEQQFPNSEVTLCSETSSLHFGRFGLRHSMSARDETEEKQSATVQLVVPQTDAHNTKNTQKLSMCTCMIHRGDLPAG